MPELPEVETTVRGLAPLIEGRHFTRIEIRQPRLRWPVPGNLERQLSHRPILNIGRRGKYLLLETGQGTLIIHLGMSGSLRISEVATELRKHDHAVFHLDDGRRLIFHDPRRFGALLWTESPAGEHPLLKSLGLEPFDDLFDGTWLHRKAQSSRCPVKSLIMNQQVVVGVGNIYANEALFVAGIRPDRIARTIARKRYDRLCKAIGEVLSQAIDQGGTTLRDFTNEKGQPGYFQLALNVYGRGNLPCPACGTPIRVTRTGQRATYYCPRCQR